MRRQPERLVFIDETSVKTNLTRLRGRACRGQRLRMDAPLGGRGMQTFIACLTSEGLIAPWGIKGAMDGSVFATCIRDVLAPELTPGSVVILDNLATHRNVEAAEAVRAAKCRFLYLPPYSPDLNPIEQAFSVFSYVRYAVSYRDLEEIMLERGINVDHATLNRWVVKFAP
ncbi:IS630 family transposase, partial [Paracoccus sp. JM45]